MLHKIQEGAASSSFGLHVAKMAGIPEQVLTAATHYLTEQNSLNRAVAYSEVGYEINHAKIDKAYANADESLNAAQKPAEQSQLSNAASLTQTRKFNSYEVGEMTESTPINPKAMLVFEKLQQLHPDELTPRQALDLLYELKSNT